MDNFTKIVVVIALLYFSWVWGFIKGGDSMLGEYCFYNNSSYVFIDKELKDAYGNRNTCVSDDGIIPIEFFNGYD